MSSVKIKHATRCHLWNLNWSFTFDGCNPAYHYKAFRSDTRLWVNAESLQAVIYGIPNYINFEYLRSWGPHYSKWCLTFFHNICIPLHKHSHVTNSLYSGWHIWYQFRYSNYMTISKKRNITISTLLFWNVWSFIKYHVMFFYLLRNGEMSWVVCKRGYPSETHL